MQAAKAVRLIFMVRFFVGRSKLKGDQVIGYWLMVIGREGFAQISFDAFSLSRSMTEAH
jgi:hypothetical protein